MISINNLTKRFGKFCAINNLTLNIKKGEFYCLLGPNGAGKTTTLKIIAGLMRPDEGEVLVNGSDVTRNYLEVKKILGFIPDTPFLYENLTPYEFLEFVGDIFGLPKDKVLETIEYYFNIFSLHEYRDTLIRELSHGTRQKVVYISNFIHSPLVYLIDEPLVGLDPYHIHLIKKILKEKTGKGITILMCTHILSIAEELADRIGILGDGKLIAEGTVEELKNKLSADSLEKAFLDITCKPQ